MRKVLILSSLLVFGGCATQSGAKKNRIYKRTSLNEFNPSAELAKLQFALKHFPEILDKRKISTKMRIPIIKTLKQAERQLTPLIAKYKNTKAEFTMRDLNIEAKELNVSLKKISFLINNLSKYGYPSDDCWQNCKKDCGQNSIGDWICHFTCYHCCMTQGGAWICK